MILERMLSPRLTLYLFIVLVVLMLALGSWWIVFMSNVVEEKIELAQELNASPELIESIRQEEGHRRLMITSEGVFFLLVLVGGCWLIYRAYVRARELNLQQENFVLSTTHELKTPIASLRVFLDGLQSDDLPCEKKEEIIPKMHHDLFRLQRTVENLLETGRLDRISKYTETNRFDLSKLVEERLDQLNQLQTKVPLRLESDLEGPAWIDGDRTAVGRAIDAVLENSLKYHRGKEIVVHVALVLKQGHVQLSVTDQGIGIEKSNQRYVFDRFVRVGEERTRQFEGSGLGLYICKKIVKAHGGSVQVHSDGLGSGSTFTLQFKRASHE